MTWWIEFISKFIICELETWVQSEPNKKLKTIEYQLLHCFCLAFTYHEHMLPPFISSLFEKMRRTIFWGSCFGQITSNATDRYSSFYSTLYTFHSIMIVSCTCTWVFYSAQNLSILMASNLAWYRCKFQISIQGRPLMSIRAGSKSNLPYRRKKTG